MIKKIILWSFVVLLCLAGLLSYVGYRSFNAETFKDQIVQSVQKATGRTLTINGPYQLVWRPLPTMTLEQVTLSNIPGSQKENMLQAEKIQLQIEWTSLFKSPIRIKSLVIEKPVVSVELLSRATNNLQFPVLFAPKNVLTSEASFEENTVQAQIDNIRIEDGQLDYINYVTKQSYTLSDINGDIAMGTLSGPFKFEGSGTFQNIVFDINISLGTHELSQPTDFIADFIATSLNTTIKLDAQFEPENTDTFLTGSISLDMEQPNDVLKHFNQPLLPAKYNITTATNFSMELGVTKTLISDFILKIGSKDDNDTLTATATYTKESTSVPGKLDLTLSSINLDDWLETFSSLAHQKIESDTALQFHLTIPQVIWHNQTATTLNLEGEVDKNQIQVRNGSVLLPGSSTTQFSGQLKKEDTSFGLQADVDLQSQNFAALLSFINPPQSKLTDLLKNVQQTEFKSTINWTPNLFSVDFPALSINNATGTALFAQQPTQPTQIVLHLDNIDLNTYVPMPQKGYTLAEVSQDIKNHLQTIQPPTNPTHIEFMFNNAEWQKTIFDSIMLVANTAEQQTDIEASLSTQSADFLSLKTTIQNIGTPDWALTQNNFEIQVSDLPEVLQNLNIKSENGWLQNLHQLSIVGGIEGQSKNWQLTTKAQTPTMFLDIAGKLTDNQPDPLKITLHHNSAPNFFFDLWGKNPLPNLDGEFTFEVNLTQQNQTLVLSDIMIMADTEQLDGNALYNSTAQEWTATLHSTNLDLHKILPEMNLWHSDSTGFTKTPFDFSFFNHMKGTFNLSADDLFYQTTHLKKASLQAHIQDKTFILDNLITTGDGATPSTVQAQGSLTWAQTPSFNLKIVTQALPLSTPFMMFEGIGLTDGTLTSEWNLTSFGETPLQMAQNLQGQGQVYLEKSTWIGADLSSLLNVLEKAQQQNESADILTAQIKQSLSKGRTLVDAIQTPFTITKGLWQTTHATLHTPEAIATDVTIDWDIPSTHIRANIPLKLTGYTNLPSPILEFIKNQKGVFYTAQTDAFTSNILSEIEKRKQQQQEAERQAQQKALEKELFDAKQTALNTLQQLSDLVTFWEQQLATTPDEDIQKETEKAQTLQADLNTKINQPGLTTQQYNQITLQAGQTLSDINKAQMNFTHRQKERFKTNSQQLVKQAEPLVGQMKELYQKRPTLSILADLIQQAEEEVNIMNRALDQYQKNLSFTQIKQVSDIIQKSRDKIGQIYEYAEDIYSGRQSITTNTFINRTSP